MKYLTIILTGCLVAACATPYRGPSVPQMAKLCDQDSHTMTTIPGCIDAHFSKWRKDWRSINDNNAQRLDYLITYGEKLGNRELKGELSPDQSVALFMRELGEVDRAAALERRHNEAVAAQRATAGNAAIIGGAMIMSSPASQPVYAPPAPITPYPADTTINVQQPRQYKFMDSAPYK